MQIAKSDFPFAFWNKRALLFTIEGINLSCPKEVGEYSLLKNKWKLHSLLPQATCDSSAVVLH